MEVVLIEYVEFPVSVVSLNDGLLSDESCRSYVSCDTHSLVRGVRWRW
jgi:hypothetical protein